MIALPKIRLLRVVGPDDKTSAGRRYGVESEERAADGSVGIYGSTTRRSRRSSRLAGGARASAT
jgi:hypothetical protein